MDNLRSLFTRRPAQPPIQARSDQTAVHGRALQLNQVKDYDRPGGFRAAVSLSHLGARVRSGVNNIAHPPTYQKSGEPKSRIDWGKFVGRPHDDKPTHDWQQPLMRSDNKGKLRMNNTTTGHALAERLNQESAYTDIAMHNDSTTIPAGGAAADVVYPPGADAFFSYTMKDREDHHRQVIQTPAVITALKASLPDSLAGLMSADGRRAGHVTLAESSGIFTDRFGKQFCQRDQKLYSFDPDANRWQPEQPDIQDIRRLSLNHEEGISLLRANDGYADKFATRQHSALLNRQGVEVTLNNVEAGAVQHLRLTSAADAPFKAREIGILENGPRPRLFAIDADGKLYKSPLLPEVSAGAGAASVVMEPMPDDFMRNGLGDASGGGSRVHGFFHEDGLKAVVEDRYGRYHASSLDEQQLHPGWLISGQWQAGSREGLPPVIKAGDTKVTLHGGAALALSKDKNELYGWEENFQDWRRLRGHDVQALGHGLDNKAYVIQAGQLKPAHTAFDHQKLDFTSEEAADFGRSTTLSLGAPMLPGTEVKAFAVVDAKNFVTLEVSNSNTPTISAHINGQKQRLPFPPGFALDDAAGAAAPRLTMDRDRNLYMLAGGTVHILPESKWKEPRLTGEHWQPAAMEFNKASADAVVIERPIAADAREANENLPFAEAIGPLHNHSDMLNERALAAITELHNAGVAIPGATVKISGLTLGQNNRPVLDTQLMRDGVAVLEQRLEMVRDSRTNSVQLRPIGEDGPAAQNGQYENSERTHHKTKNQALGRFNGSSGAHFFGHDSDNTRTRAGMMKNLKKSLTHHFHPLEGMQKTADDAKAAAGRADGFGASVQAILHSLLTSQSREREGLKPLYQESARLYSSLDKLSRLPEGRVQQGGDLESRINTRLAGNSPEQQRLREEFHSLRKELEASSDVFVTRLGRIEGYLDEQGLPLPGREFNKKPPPRGTDIDKLTLSMKASRPSVTNLAGAKLVTLERLGMKLKRRDLDRGLGQYGQDKSASGLVVDRLMLNAQVMQDMHRLLDELDGANQPRTEEGRRKELLGLRLDLDASRVKLLSDRNFVNHGAVETMHDARNAFATEATGRHGLRLNLEKTFGAENQRLDALKTHFGNMEDRDQLAVTRSKGTTLATPLLFVGISPDGGGTATQISASSIRELGLSIEGSKDGTWMGLKSDHSLSGALSFGYWHAPSAVVKLFTQGTVGELYSIDAQAQITRTTGTTSYLQVDRHDMAEYRENMHDVNASLSDLYRLGKSAMVEHKKHWVGDLDLSATADAFRLNLGGNYGSRPGVPRSNVNELFRTTIGIRANANLLHGEARTMDTYMDGGMEMRTDVKQAQALARGGFGAYYRPIGHTINGNVDSDPYPNSQGVLNDVSISQINMLEASVRVVLDRGKANRYELAFKPALPVSTSELHTLEGNIKAHFSQRLDGLLHDEIAGVLELVQRNQAVANTSLHRLTATSTFNEFAAAVSQLDGPHRVNLRISLQRAAPEAMQLYELLNTAGRAVGEGKELEDGTAHLQALKTWMDQKLARPANQQSWKASTESEFQVAVRRGLESLQRSSSAAARGERVFASAERTFSLPGLGKRRDGLTSDKAPWRTYTSDENARMISELLKNHPILHELATRTENEGATNVQIITELKDSVREELEIKFRESLKASEQRLAAAGLEDSITPSAEIDFAVELKKALGDPKNLRIKRLTTFRPADHTDSFTTPTFGIAKSSSATISDAPALSSFIFEYSKKNEDQPIAASPDGRLMQSGTTQRSRDAMTAENGRIITSSRPGAARPARHQEQPEQGGQPARGDAAATGAPTPANPGGRVW